MTAAAGRLVLHLRDPELFPARRRAAPGPSSPQASIDGQPVPVGWGDNTIPINPGTHRLQVSSVHRSEYGRAETALDVAPGEVVTLHYSSPVWRYATATIGPQPQPQRGRTLMLTVLASMLVLPVFLVAAMIVLVAVI